MKMSNYCLTYYYESNRGSKKFKQTDKFDSKFMEDSKIEIIWL